MEAVTRSEQLMLQAFCETINSGTQKLNAHVQRDIKQWWALDLCRWVLHLWFLQCLPAWLAETFENCRIWANLFWLFMIYSWGRVIHLQNSAEVKSWLCERYCLYSFLLSRFYCVVEYNFNFTYDFVFMTSPLHRTDVLCFLWGDCFFSAFVFYYLATIIVQNL